MPRKIEPGTPIQADFFFADPVRSTMSPVLIASMTLAYQWSELIGSGGFLTEPQMYQALGQISAHGFRIEDVLRDLVVLNQLDDVGTGYQLPLLRVHRERLAHAASAKKQYHKKAAQRSGKSSGVSIPPNTMGARAKAGSVAPNAGFRDEPVSEVRQRAPEPVEHAGSIADANGKNTDGRSRTRPLHSDNSALRSERSSLTQTTSEVGRSGSGFDFSNSQKAEAEQTQAPASGAASPESATKEWDQAAADPTYGLSPDDFECVTELLAKFRSPVSLLPPERRGQLCTRQNYAPPADLLARWVELMPMDQIVKDLERYREKGVSDSIAVREHDSRFESFMRNGTMRFKRDLMMKRVVDQRELRAAVKRAKEQNRKHIELMSNSRAGLRILRPTQPTPSTKPAPAADIPLSPREKAAAAQDLRKKQEAEHWKRVQAARAADRLKEKEQANVA